MSKHTRKNQPVITSLLAEENIVSDSSETKTAELDHISELGKPRDWKRRILYPAAACALLFLIGMGVMAKNGWLPTTDAMTGKKTGWFGAELAKNASSSWNPVAAPLPTATPALSKEYIYAGSRLLAVEDANASAAPPADLAVWRESTGYWYVLGGVQGSQFTSAQFGQAGDKPVAGDFDGDGKTDFSVYRPASAAQGTTQSWWYVLPSTGGTLQSYPFGGEGDEAFASDFDGDGRSDLLVWRSSNGTWYISQSSNNFSTTLSIAYGQAGDVPVPADFDGDGRADLGVWRTSGNDGYFYVAQSSTNYSTSTYATYQFGTPGDKLVVADYDGDGRADPAVYRMSNGLGTYYIKQSSNAQIVHEQWGGTNDVLVPNDYDADGKADMAVWRPANGNWYIRNSSTGALRQVQWGQSGDIPVPAYYRR